MKFILTVAIAFMIALPSSQVSAMAIEPHESQLATLSSLVAELQTLVAKLQYARVLQQTYPSGQVAGTQITSEGLVVSVAGENVLSLNTGPTSAEAYRECSAFTNNPDHQNKRVVCIYNGAIMHDDIVHTN